MFTPQSVNQACHSVEEIHKWFGGCIGQLLDYSNLALIEAFAPVFFNTLINELVLLHGGSIVVVLIDGSIKVGPLPNVADMLAPVLHMLSFLDAEHQHRLLVLELLKVKHGYG